MKKAISLILCLVLCLSFCVTAFATVAPAVSPTAMSSAIMGKVLKVAKGVDFAAAGANTFAFSFAGQDGAPAPTGTTSITVAGWADGKATGTLKMSDVFPESMLGATGGFTHAGEYIYIVTETTEGYTDKTDKKEGYKCSLVVNDEFSDKTVFYKLRVYVINETTGDDAYKKLKYEGVTVEKWTKAGTTETSEGKITPSETNFKFENSFMETKLGSSDAPVFSVTKLVEGTYANAEQPFTITVSLALPAGHSIANDVEIESTGSAASLTGTTYTVDLAHNQALKFKTLPVGTVVTVSEGAVQYYKATIKNGDTEIDSDTYNTAVSADVEMAETNIAITVTNEIQEVTHEGIEVNNLPFVMIVVLALAGMTVYFVSNRRKAEEN